MPKSYNGNISKTEAEPS